MKIKASNANTPNWKEITVKASIPAELKKRFLLFAFSISFGETLYFFAIDQRDSFSSG